MLVLFGILLMVAAAVLGFFIGWAYYNLNADNWQVIGGLNAYSEHDDDDNGSSYTWLLLVALQMALAYYGSQLIEANSNTDFGLFKWCIQVPIALAIGLVSCWLWRRAQPQNY